MQASGVQRSPTRRLGASPSTSRAARHTRARASRTASDLLVVGPGVLGRLVGSSWLQANPGARIVGQTRTDVNHEELRALGFDPRTADPEAPGSRERFPFVVFSAPPSGSSDYVGEVARAVDRWTGDGALVFTSSAAVYDVSEGSCVDDSPTKALGESERIDRLIRSEQEVLDAGGCVVRLVGLYHSVRGAHMHFLKLGTVPRSGQSMINLIHYEDAASLCVSAMRWSASRSSEGEGGKGQPQGKVFLGADSNPVTFQEMMDATFMSRHYTGACTFVGEPPELAGKRVSNPRTAKELQWAPAFESYAKFMAAGPEDSFLGTEEVVA